MEIFKVYNGNLGSLGCMGSKTYLETTNRVREFLVQKF